MRIAVAYEDGYVFRHFGHTAQFKIYDTHAGHVTASRVVDADGSGHCALAALLRQLQVDALICGGIGGCAVTALTGANIRLYGGVSGDADEAVESFLAGVLEFDPHVRCEHHSEGHGCGGCSHG